MRTRQLNKQGGFTLLEALVATMIMGIAVAGILEALTASTRNVIRLTQADRAVLLARTKMDELLVNDGLIRKADLGGPFTAAEAGAMTAGWLARVTPIESAPRGDGAQLGGRSHHSRNLVDGWRHTPQFFSRRLPQVALAAGRGHLVRRTRQAGFTLMELMISITLVAAIATGMLLAMRGGLLSLNKTQTRLDENRRALGVQRDSLCNSRERCRPGLACSGQLSPYAFRGTATALQMVSTYSIAEGSRGTPHIVEYQVAPDEGATLKLIVYERLYAGPASTAGFCSEGVVLQGIAPALCGRESFSILPVFLFPDESGHAVSWR